MCMENVHGPLFWLILIFLSILYGWLEITWKGNHIPSHPFDAVVITNTTHHRDVYCLSCRLLCIILTGISLRASYATRAWWHPNSAAIVTGNHGTNETARLIGCCPAPAFRRFHPLERCWEFCLRHNLCLELTGKLASKKGRISTCLGLGRWGSGSGS